MNVEALTRQFARIGANLEVAERPTVRGRDGATNFSLDIQEEGRREFYLLEIAKPANVRRIGLRYLNRVEIPLPFRDFQEFCLLFPELPPKIPQALTEFFLRFAVPVESVPAAAASVTLTFEPPQQAATLPLI